MIGYAILVYLSFIKCTLVSSSLECIVMYVMLNRPTVKQFTRHIDLNLPLQTASRGNNEPATPYTDVLHTHTRPNVI